MTSADVVSERDTHNVDSLASVAFGAGREVV